MQVKNKMPATLQITAEQLLREAKERELELVQPVSGNILCKLLLSHTKYLLVFIIIFCHICYVTFFVL